MYRPPIVSWTPVSAAYASPTAKPAATSAVVPRRAFFICLSLVLEQADASTGPPLQNVLWSAPVSGIPQVGRAAGHGPMAEEILRLSVRGSRQSGGPAVFFRNLWQFCHRECGHRLNGKRLRIKPFFARAFGRARFCDRVR